MSTELYYGACSGLVQTQIISKFYASALSAHGDPDLPEDSHDKGSDTSSNEAIAKALEEQKDPWLEMRETKKKKKKKDKNKDSFCSKVNPSSMVRRRLGFYSSSSGSSGSTSTRNHNRFGPLADKEEPEPESSDATTVVLPVQEITVQVQDKPAIVRTHSNESCDDSLNLDEILINKSAAPTQGEQGNQLTLDKQAEEPAEEAKQDFHKASSE